METRGEGRKKTLGESRKAGKLLFKTQMTAIKLGWDMHSRGIYFISVFSSMLDRIS